MHKLQGRLLELLNMQFGDVNTKATELFVSSKSNEGNLLQSHVDAWKELWKSGIEVSGDQSLSNIVKSSQYCTYLSDFPHSRYIIKPQK